MTPEVLVARLRFIASKATHLAESFDLSPELAPTDHGTALALDGVDEEFERIARLAVVAAQQRRAS